MVPGEERLRHAFAEAAGDREHGAGAIERQLIERLLQCQGAWRGQLLREGAEQLRRHQASMASVLALAHRLERLDTDELGTYLRRRAALLDHMAQLLAARVLPHLERCGRVVTVSRSSTVAGVLTAAAASGWDRQVVVLDGTESGRGEDQAKELAGHGVQAVSQPDATATRWLDDEAGTVLVMVGADAVGSHRFVNCTGTGMLLELAAARDLERLLVADTGKVLDDRLLDEIVAAGRWCEDRHGRSWPVFESVSMTLISSWIREDSVADDEAG